IYVLFQVNGQDVSNSSHEDAVRYFQSAQEPIIVEVLRRQPGQQTAAQTSNKEPETIDTLPVEERPVTTENCKKDPESPLVSTGVQTDWAGLIEEEELLPGALNPEEQTNDSFEDFLPHDIDFEEVTLRRSGSAEKLGLTVCYSSGSGSEDVDTEVYISEIVPESLAARDGRLREGDQILRVNGKDVANKEQTENLFAETKSAVTILVSRCLYQDDDYDDRRIYHQGSPPISPDNIPAYQNSMIEQLIRQQQQTDDRTKDSEPNTSTLKVPPPIPSHTTLHTSHIQAPPPPPPISSGTNCSTSSSTASSQNSQKSGKTTTSPAHHNTEDRKQWMQDTLKECTKKMDSLNLRAQQPGPLTPPLNVKLVEAYSSHVWSDTEHIYETIPESDSEPIYSSPYEHHQHWVQNQSSQAQIQSSQVQNQNQANQTKPWHSSSKSNSSGEEKDSSSAYNTGESCHSNPLTLELHQGERDHHKSTLVLCPPKVPHQPKISCSCPQSVTQTGKLSKTQPSRKSSHHHRDRDTTNASTLPADTMYTNVANLQQTMLLQQQLFKQALNRKNSIITREPVARKSKSHGNFQAPNLTQYQFVGSQQVCTSTTTWEPPEDKCEVQMEWKVKRRPDGTRYIARRPVRNRILRNRAIKISEERAGHTTEDDTMSEMKIGRYWSKEERKRQLERGRERKQRQQEILIQQQQQQLQLQQVNELLICEHTEEKMIKKPLNIVELSYKKMARKKTALDDFTTVQEMLVHGNRVGTGSGPGTGGKLMGLLSVTTV
ncbi:PDZ domain-containing protein 4, partial [Cephus cinctus]|uniref:PDZ domain-containing protein 4 n=1 Tax=Cephus cinctus TaxID=211228 RepID=A0AAJ7CB97_CEPCN